MVFPMERAGHVEVRLASTLRPLRRTPRARVLVSAAVQGLLIGATVGVIAATGWVASPASTLAIGGAAVLYAFLSFASETPPES
jgi:hypothetical protein